MDDRIGKTVSHYKIIKKLGQGGMGVVYAATDTRLKRAVAIKFLPPHMTRDQEANTRFMHEAQAASALEHHNICNIHEIDLTEDGQLFVVMALYEGETLEKRIERGALPMQEALEIAGQIAQGLAKAHEQGIVHRDIKPSNIFITTDGMVKLIDFGLAKLRGRTKVTRENATPGTVAYMSPEQARGDDVDPKSDIWSLGVILYEMLTGKTPFRGEYEPAVIYSILNEKAVPVGTVNPECCADIQPVMDRLLQKNPDLRYASAIDFRKDIYPFQNMASDLKRPKVGIKWLLRRLRKPRIVIPFVALLIIFLILAGRFFHHRSRVRLARETLLPEIKQLMEAPVVNSQKIYDLAVKAEKHLPDHPDLVTYFSEYCVTLTVTTEPPGAKIYSKYYHKPESEWRYDGLSPLEIRAPITFLRLKMIRENYEPVFAAASTFGVNVSSKEIFKPNRISRTLIKNGEQPQGMVHVSGKETSFGPLPDFYIDKYEVTNKAFKKFIDHNGYRNRSYWNHPFIKEGKDLSWEEAMAEFVDRTGRPGPANWQVGDYADGEDNYPVTGISWYEAAAFADFADKHLPTAYHWGQALGLLRTGASNHIIPLSNFKKRGIEPAGHNQALSAFGAYDMAGNAREWCSNPSPKGRIIRGGAWNDNTYMYRNWSQASAFDRSEKNGFRCVVYLKPEKIPDKAFENVNFSKNIDYSTQKPVSNAVFQVYKTQFSYDKTALNARVEWIDSTSVDWTAEKITVDAAYGEERLIAYLFIPRQSTPPYQTVIYFPGASSVHQKSSENLHKHIEFFGYLKNIIKDGRAVLYPLYKGTFERRGNIPSSLHGGSQTHRYTEYIIKVVKDFRRCIDYLQTRKDINGKKFAYFGMSWGGRIAPIILAVEDRLQAAVLALGGLRDRARPEARMVHYLPRVQIPILMLNGKYDMTFYFETQVKPMFDLFGTPEENKKIVVYETDHYLPKNKVTKETLDWLDKYLGSVH